MIPTEVLIIDPDISFITVIRRALELNNEFTARIFTGGHAGVESSVLYPPAVVILDFAIRDMTIAELVEQLRKLHPNLPIIVTPRTRDHLLQVEALGVQRSIGKPYMARQLIPYLRELSGAPETTTTAPTALPRRLPEQEFSPGLQQTTVPVIEPEIPAGATMRDLMDVLRGTQADSSIDSSAGAAVVEPALHPVADTTKLPPLPESFTMPVDMSADEAIIAEQALKISGDDTIPLSETSISEVIKQAEIEKAERGYTIGLQTSTLTELRSELPSDAENSVAAALSSLNAQAMQSALLAVKFTQLTLDPVLTATMLSHGNILIAMAGELDTSYADQIHRKMQDLLATTSNPEAELIRDISLDRGIEFGLFSRQTADGMRLTLVFAADASFKQIRNQALLIEQTLIKFPDTAYEFNDPQTDPEASNFAVDLAVDIEIGPETDPEVEADRDLEPEAGIATRPRRPEGLDQAIADRGERTGANAAASFVGASFMWLARQDELSTQVQTNLPTILEQIITEQGWELLGYTVMPTYVLVQVNADADLTVPAIVESLMFDSAELIGDNELWADSYLAATSNRAITQREIDTFLSFAKVAAT